MNVLDFQKMKENNEKITMVTCYDYWSAQLISQTSINCVLVGDSASMVMHGYSTTVPASVAMMLYHIQAVVKGTSNQFIIGDMPFCSYRKGLTFTMETVEAFMKAGAHAIKLEGADDNLPTISHIVKSGVPVMGHIGLTPQSVHALGGFKVQGKNDETASALLEQAFQLQSAGCFAIVLECVPHRVATHITAELTIPTIGIGAGPHTSGQVLVLQDLLGLSDQRKPKFLKHYLDGATLVKNALNAYNNEVKQAQFPVLEEHCY